MKKEVGKHNSGEKSEVFNKFEKINKIFEEVSEMVEIQKKYKNIIYLGKSEILIANSQEGILWERLLKEYLENNQKIAESLKDYIDFVFKKWKTRG